MLEMYWHIEYLEHSHWSALSLHQHSEQLHSPWVPRGPLQDFVKRRRITVPRSQQKVSSTDKRLRSSGGFPSHGTPSCHPFVVEFVHQKKPSSYWSTPQFFWCRSWSTSLARRRWHGKTWSVCVTMEWNHCWFFLYMGMDQYLLIPFLGGWTSIYQLFWCSPGVQGFDTLPYIYRAEAGGSPEANCNLIVWICKMLILHCVLQCFLPSLESVPSVKVSMSARINSEFVRAEKW